MRRAAAALAVVLLSVGPALAHSEVPGVRSVIEASSPALPDGVRATVLVSASDQLVVENSGAEDVEVLDEHGRPFLRIGPAGTFGDLGAEAWHRSLQPEGTGALPQGLDPTSPPRWEKVSEARTWGWFDHRLHPEPVAAPPGARPGERHVLARWVVPLRIGGRVHRLEGRREFLRLAGSVVAEVVRDRLPAGLTASAAAGKVPALFVDASAAVPRGDVVILGEGGEPMVRLSRRGAEANLASPTLGPTLGSRGIDTGRPVGAEVPPRWTTLGSAPSLAWLEPRARLAADPGSDVQASRTPVVLRTWSVPVVVAGTPVALEGVLRWVPDAALARRTPGGVPSWVWLALLAGGGLVAGLPIGRALGRRRQARR